MIPRRGSLSNTETDGQTRCDRLFVKTFKQYFNLTYMQD